MTDPPGPVFVLPGASGRAPDLGLFRAGAHDMTPIEMIGYPGWSRYVQGGFSAEALIADLAARIAARVPHGPIRIVGISIGGHFGYAVALRLRTIGRDVAGFCAIDTFMIASSEPSAGWTGRHLRQGLYLLRQRRIAAFVRFVRSLFWRSLLRLAGGRLPGLLRGPASSGRLPWALAFDPVCEEELSMRLLLRGVAPWVALLDRDPVALDAPVILLRTPHTAGDDAAWRHRCPKLEIVDIPGAHQTLFEPENIDSLHTAFLAATTGWRATMGQ